MYGLILLFLFVFFSESVSADDSYHVVGSSLEFGNSKNCLLSKIPQYAIESFDRSAVMVSESGYVLTQELSHCQVGHPVRVLSIPSNVGVLSDINVSKGIYVALDFVATQPFAYLATVARLGSSRNLVSISGAYVASKKLSDLKKFSFGGSGDAGTSIISSSGRFVAPNGQIDCKGDAYPGVWDIRRNRRVVTTDDACAALFK
jgi:hypothetical protein